MKITKAEFDEVYNPDVTKRRYDEIIGKIDNRFNQIAEHIVKKSPTCGWFDYDNCEYDVEGPTGYFDPKKHKTDIGVGGEYVSMPPPYDDMSFPTRWLWEDYEQEFESNVQNVKKEEAAKKLREKQARDASKIRKEEMKKAITSKLTKEELKYIYFK